MLTKYQYSSGSSKGALSERSLQPRDPVRNILLLAQCMAPARTATTSSSGWVVLRFWESGAAARFEDWSNYCFSEYKYYLVSIGCLGPPTFPRLDCIGQNEAMPILGRKLNTRIIPSAAETCCTKQGCSVAQQLSPFEAAK